MSTIKDTARPLSRKRRWVFILSLWSFFAIVLLLLAEVVLRISGSASPRLICPPLSSQPGKFFSKHETLGFIYNPGEFRVALGKHYLFKTTHLPNRLRITHPLNTYPAKTRKKIWIVGCSFTYGWILNDEQTYPWLLQKRLKNYEVVNFGVISYSTLQSLLQFREALKIDNKPDLVILAYASFHDMRNTGTRHWMKIMTVAGNYPYFKIPVVKLTKNNNLEITYTSFEYQEIPLARYSALANTLDELYNSLLADPYRDHQISRVLIEEFSNICEAKGIKFVVAGIDCDPATAEMLEALKKKGTMTVDISVDLHIIENNIIPSWHPSAIANEQYEKKLENYLCRMKLINDPICAR